MIGNSIAGFLSATTPTSYQSIVLADNPLGFWMLNETSTTTATDLTANAHNLTLTSTPTTNVSTGMTGITKSITFNGTNQYGYSGTQAQYNSSAASSWSMEGWFKTTSTTIGGVVVWRDKVSVNDYTINGALFANYNTGKIMLYTETSGGSNLLLESTSTINTGSWFHVCVTAAAGGNLTLYINGTSEASSSTARKTDTSNREVTIAAQQATSSIVNAYLAGGMAGVAIYNSTLTGAQVLSHYNAGK